LCVVVVVCVADDPDLPPQEATAKLLANTANSVRTAVNGVRLIARQP